MHVDTTIPAGIGAERPAVPGARHALLLLVLINLFNYLDRQVLAAVEPDVRREFFQTTDPETGKVVEYEHAKTLMGGLSFAFLVTYMFTAPIFGALATRMSRWWLIGIGVLVWSLASGASGLAPHWAEGYGKAPLLLFGYVLPFAYVIMILTRCFVGLGEAVYGPVAPDIIADLFPASRRGQVLAWFYAAIPFGGALGYALGAEVSKGYGWQYAFYVVVPPGLLLTVWCLFMKEPRRGQSEIVSTIIHQPKLSDYLFLLKTPSYALNTAGMTFMCFAMGGLAFWAPGFLKHLGVEPVFGAIAPATFFGLLTALLGLAATILGGILGDRFRKRHGGSYFLVSGTAMIVGFPMLLLMVYLPFPIAWIPMGAFVFCLFFNTGPTNTILANVVHPMLRPTGFALNILIIHLFGDAISPSVMGWIIGSENRYDLAFGVVAFTVLLGGILWMWGARYLERDTAAAPTRLPGVTTFTYTE